MKLRRSTLIILLLTILASSWINQAEGQFWKRKKHKKQSQQTLATDSVSKADTQSEPEPKSRKELKREKKKNKKEAKQKRKEIRRKEKENERRKKLGLDKEVVAPPKPVIIDKWAEIPYPPTVKKPGYRIDVLAPIYLDELVKAGNVTFKENIPEKAAPGLNYYIGVQMAADSLKHSQVDMDIYVHDVASVAESVDKLVNNHVLDSSDLIIGAITSHDIPQIAEFAKKKNINFVSATSPVDGGVRDDQFYTMLQPSLKTHSEWLLDNVVMRNTDHKMVLMYRTKTQTDENAYKYLSVNHEGDYSSTLLCNSVPGKGALAPLIDTAHENDIVMAFLDNNFADSVLKFLGKHFPKTHFVIYGMPDWNNNTLSLPRQYPNLVINLTTPFYANPDAPSTWYVAEMYKKEYGGKPNEMVYRGFETVIWYANLLKRYGTIFNHHYDDYETAPFTRFEIKPQWDANGNVMYLENRQVTLRKYDSKSIIVK